MTSKTHPSTIGAIGKSSHLTSSHWQCPQGPPSYSIQPTQLHCQTTWNGGGNLIFVAMEPWGNTFLCPKRDTSHVLGKLSTKNPFSLTLPFSMGPEISPKERYLQMSTRLCCVEGQTDAYLTIGNILITGK